MTRNGLLVIGRRVLAFELGLWRSLYRWIFRRPPTRDPATAAFGYSAAQAPVFWTFIVLSALEVPAVHLLLPWDAARTVVDVIGVYGLFWMLGLLASVRVHPHLIGPAGIRLRSGLTVDVTVPWEAVASVTKRARSTPKGRTVQVEQTDSGTALSIVVLSQTNVDIVLREPITVPLSWGRRHEAVIELRCYADDPKAFIARAVDASRR
jgi:hypothetical protein